MKNLKNIESLITDIISFEKTENKKIIFYLRLYTYLLIASENLRLGAFRDCIYNLRIAKKFAADCEFKKENIYAKRIKNISDALISGLKNIRKKEDYKTEYHRLDVLLSTAQGICILRILKSD